MLGNNKINTVNLLIFINRQLNIASEAISDNNLDINEKVFSQAHATDN
ncbi:20447_t:CDS:2 [Gigaspora margarita]|uniref:20447_t:CDS:1 n=1 Tax=Gigaspora margarita TaxID=4874 RepID=A0ABN7UNP2_GIGMA|nr:20447_t:CDS:2 [Gigaspora margarita]